MYFHGCLEHTHSISVFLSRVSKSSQRRDPSRSLTAKTLSLRLKATENLNALYCMSAPPPNRCTHNIHPLQITQKRKDAIWLAAQKVERDSKICLKKCMDSCKSKFWHNDNKNRKQFNSVEQNWDSPSS